MKREFTTQDKKIGLHDVVWLQLKTVSHIVRAKPNADIKSIASPCIIEKVGTYEDHDEARKVFEALEAERNEKVFNTSKVWKKEAVGNTQAVEIKQEKAKAISKMWRK